MAGKAEVCAGAWGVCGAAEEPEVHDGGCQVPKGGWGKWVDWGEEVIVRKGEKKRREGKGREKKG